MRYSEGSLLLIRKMLSLTPKRRGTLHTFRVALACLCVVLVFAVGVAHLLHTHTPAEPENPNCSLCAVAHLSALPAPVATAFVVVEAIRAPRDEDPAPAVSQSVPFHQYVRPPPVA